MKLFRIKVTQAGATVERMTFHAAEDATALERHAAHWAKRYASAEPGRFRSRLFCRQERKPRATIG